MDLHSVTTQMIQVTGFIVNTKYQILICLACQEVALTTSEPTRQNLRKMLFLTSNLLQPFLFAHQSLPYNRFMVLSPPSLTIWSVRIATIDIWAQRHSTNIFVLSMTISPLISPLQFNSFLLIHITLSSQLPSWNHPHCHLSLNGKHSRNRSKPWRPCLLSPTYIDLEIWATAAHSRSKAMILYYWVSQCAHVC